MGRVALHVNAFTLDPSGNPMNPIAPADVAPTFLQFAQTGQTRRCPGSMERPKDGSSPVKTDTCDPSELPLGP
jgi:hypothetical protein